MTVKELKEMLEGLDENRQIKVSSGFRSVTDLDVYLEEEKIWSDSLGFHTVYIMRGVRD